MKKRLATLAILGAMTVSAVAPMSVFAAETHETNVKYMTGVVTPGGGDAGYYVTVPADIIFTGQNDTADQKLTLEAMDATVGLPLGLEVEVKAKSTNGAKVTNATYGEVAYTMDYEGGATGGGSSITDTSEVTVGTLKSNSAKGQTDADTDLVGLATLTGATPAGTPKGTTFTDTITYTITQTKPTI